MSAIVESKTIAPREESEFAFTDRDFRFLIEVAAERTGIVLGESKRDMVYARLARRLRALKLESFDQYCARLNHGDEVEMGHFVNAITTNLTHFFRESHHFEHLAEEIKQLVATKPERRLRIWSAGCSSGMEAYSIAMTLHRAIPQTQQWDAKILATDIDTNMLARGADGVYPLEEYKNIPNAYHGYIQHDKDTMQVDERIKALVAFKRLNLLEAWPMKCMFDMVFCRNVVIYFDKPTQKELFQRMANIIAPEGFLYIGHSENLHGVSDQFELLGRTIYRKIGR